MKDGSGMDKVGLCCDLAGLVCGLAGEIETSPMVCLLSGCNVPDIIHISKSEPPRLKYTYFKLLQTKNIASRKYAGFITCIKMLKQ